MKKKVLIVRSVSFQQLDQNMTEIVNRFPVQDYSIHLLTHGHGMEQARTYTAVSEILDYESRKNFSFFHLPGRLKKKDINYSGPYEAIIVPVTNKTGTGFLNVLAMAGRIRSHSIYICNLISEMREISRKEILGQMIKSFFFSFLAVLMAVPLAVTALPVVLVSLGKQRESSGKK